MGIRTKIYLATLLMVALLSVVSGIYLHVEVREGYEAHAQLELRQKAEVTAQALRAAFPAEDTDPKALDALVDRLAEAGGVRVSVIGPHGRLVADSLLDSKELARAEDHSLRPEVVQAREEGVGAARRVSMTVRSELFYVAVAGGVGGSIVRLATPTREVDDALLRLRLVLSAAAGLGLLLASAVGALASHFAAKTLRQLVERARAIGERGGRTLDYSGQDEIGVLAGSLNHLAEELERTVARLGQERDRLETILRGTSEGVLALDADQRIRLINAAAEHLLHLPPKVEGRPIYEVTREPDLLTLAERGADVSSTLELSMSDGERIVVGRADPLQATGGTVLVLHDVSEMRRLERIRREFVANVSHELRTPVSIIRANCETLIEGGAIDNEKARGNFLRAIGRNAERLERLVSDLLDLARIEAGKQTIAPREIAPRAVVERVVSLLVRKAEERQIEIVNEIAPHLRIYADEAVLDQILANLIDNAVKYSDHPGKVWVRAEITAAPTDFQDPELGSGHFPTAASTSVWSDAEQLQPRVEADGEMVRLCVEDEGPGIKKEARPRIFERFYRVDAGRSRDIGGTGLGLSIVKHLAQMLDGYASVEPRHPRGSRFSVTFPLRHAPPEEREPAPLPRPTGPSDLA